jgi:hypothetical protein
MKTRPEQGGEPMSFGTGIILVSTFPTSRYHIFKTTSLGLKSSVNPEVIHLIVDTNVK